MELTADQQEFKALARRVGEEQLAATAVSADRGDGFCWDSWKTLQQHGFTAMGAPERHGGLGESLLSGLIVIEQLARTNASAALTFLMPYIFSQAMSHADEELQHEFLPGVASGDDIGCFVLTEPEAGSDAGALATTARRDGDEYVLSGRKHFITNADVADVGLVYARTSGTGSKGISAFAVRMKETPGLSIGRHDSKMGMRGCSLVEVVFEDARVPGRNMIGPEGKGLHIAMNGLGVGRVLVSGIAVGLAQGALDYAIAYVKVRRQFGRALSANQGLQWMLAEAHTQIAAARELCAEAARRVTVGDAEAIMYASMAKALSTDVCMRATTDAVQLLGGYGYLSDFPVERMMRDAKILQIFEGTNQIQLNTIARFLVPAGS